MSDDRFGRVLVGHIEEARKAYDAWEKQPVDWDLSNGEALPVSRKQRTLAGPVTVKGPGTFFGRSVRTVTFEPTDMEGWWFERADLEDALPFAVSARNVWTTGDIVSNIVLRAGPPHNYVRMVEHMIALKIGMGLDNVLLKIDSGDPPLFARGSLDLVEALESAGVRETDRAARFFTVKEPVTAVSAHGGFVTLLPCDARKPALRVDCAVDFKTAIGKQRIRFPVNAGHFRYGAEARTNTSAAKMLYCKTIGRVIADIRNLGYTMDNILVAGRHGYYNEPKLMHDGKSLEAAWHRAALDLLAALALIEEGQFAGDVISYKAGHGLDVTLIKRLYRNNLLREL
ncbi:MAG: UDP-3-O-(3-hydroxymyristoyl) N-acetylglucosamine deacetylase [Verrucomicrobia bacterium ADurb.Bin345]|nr:MAG: UDP-3-O-(3-hydroxymyristoyl) N-acetylglucosamine deacetylase [Verrucomicrobia bacterium ADurb.Bin345]